MSEETPLSSENEMGNIVSGSKDLLSSSVHWLEGTEEKKAGEVIPGKEEQSGAAESETVPEQSSGGDQQQPSGNGEDTKSEDSKPSSSSSELQHDGPTESDGGKRDEQQQQQQQRNSNNTSIWDFLVRDIIRKQCEAWDNISKRRCAKPDESEAEDDLTLEVEDEEYHPIIKDDLTILDMFIIKPESVKIKNRNNKKKNKKKKWFRSKKQRKPNGKMHYIIL